MQTFFFFFIQLIYSFLTKKRFFLISLKSLIFSKSIINLVLFFKKIKLIYSFIFRENFIYIFPRYIKKTLPINSISFISKSNKLYFITPNLFLSLIKNNPHLIFLLTTNFGLFSNFNTNFFNNNLTFLCLLVHLY